MLFRGFRLALYKSIATLLTISTVFSVQAECTEDLGLSGSISIPACDRSKDSCVYAEKAVYEYANNGKDSEEILSVALTSSPWRFYDAEMRILTIEEAANLMRPAIKKPVENIFLMASWSGASPTKDTKSLADKLSKQLGDFPVSGIDGFLWLSKDGTYRSTKQKFTMRSGTGPYEIPQGGEVLVPLAVGWFAESEARFIQQNNAEGTMRAGAGWDIYMLCPDRALQVFEKSAMMGSAIGAYNAALIRLDRKKAGDAEKAKELLSLSVKLGDAKAKRILNKL